MLKIYFKSTCSTCRNALNFIKENTDEECEIIEYIKEVPTQKEIKNILKMLNLKAEDIIRKKEPLFKEKFAGKKLTEPQWVKVLHENPNLIERPIVIKDGVAVIGRPIERIKEIL